MRNWRAPLPQEPPAKRLTAPGAWFKARWRRVVGPVRKARVPYAVALGNHDRQADLSGRQILELDRRTSPGLSLTQLVRAHANSFPCWDMGCLACMQWQLLVLQPLERAAGDQQRPAAPSPQQPPTAPSRS